MLLAQSPVLLVIPTAQARTAGLSQMNKPQVAHSLIQPRSVRAQTSQIEAWGQPETLA